MLIQDLQGNLRQTSIDDRALMLDDLKQGDVFSFYNDSSKQIFLLGPDKEVIDVAATKIQWNDKFIDAGRARVIWYPEARIQLGKEQVQVSPERGSFRVNRPAVGAVKPAQGWASSPSAGGEVLAR